MEIFLVTHKGLQKKHCNEQARKNGKYPSDVIIFIALQIMDNFVILISK